MSFQHRTDLEQAVRHIEKACSEQLKHATDQIERLVAAQGEKTVTVLSQAVADVTAALNSAQAAETALLGEVVTAIANLAALVAELANTPANAAALEALVPQIQAGVAASQAALANLQAADAAAKPPTPAP